VDHGRALVWPAGCERGGGLRVIARQNYVVVTSFPSSAVYFSRAVISLPRKQRETLKFGNDKVRTVQDKTYLCRICHT
jgi:hypothetical protein